MTAPRRSSAWAASPSRWNTWTVVSQLAYYGIAHVTCARDDANASQFLLAMLPGIAHQVPHNLIEMAAIENRQQLFGTHDRDASFRNALGFHDLPDQRVHEFAQRNDFRLLAVTAVELQHFPDDAVDALGVALNHRQKAMSFRSDRSVFLQKLCCLIDR